MIGILRSMAQVMRVVARRPVTIQYPEVHREIPNRDRAFPILLWDFDVDESFCTGC